MFYYIIHYGSGEVKLNIDFGVVVCDLYYVWNYLLIALFECGGEKIKIPANN